MIEFTEVTRHPFKLQERYDWYKVNSLLIEMERVGVELGLRPEDLVHIGGTAVFYHAYHAFGPKALPNFRGTHDMDIISFSQGSLQRVLDRIMKDSNSLVREYHISRSHLPGKRTIHVTLDKSNDPGGLSAFDIDYYEFTGRTVTFNDRQITKTRIVLDPPERLELQTLNPQRDRGLVAVPSLRDSFIIKMDIVDYSRLGLRSKDKLDVLTIFAICKTLGHDYNYLLEALVQTSSKDSVNLKLTELEKLFTTPRREIAIMGSSNPLLPTQEQITQALNSVKHFR